MRPARNVDEIIGRMRDKVVLRLGDYGVHFEDREYEVREFLNNVLKLERVAFIYGPFGAGKTTFLKTIAEAMEGGDTMFVYYDYNPAIIRESMPEIMAYVGYGVKNAVLEALKSIEVGMPISAAGFTLSMNLRKVLDVIIDVLRRHGGELSRIENVVFVIDEYDRYLREKLRDFEYHDIGGVAGGFAQCMEHRDVMERTFRDLA
jgi:translation initiation factor RLI1